MAKDYIQWLRSKVGHEKVILVFAGGCILNDAGEVLLQRRGDSGLWGFPGGAIELGESPERAAVREIKEETGLDVTVTDLIGIYTDPDMVYPNGDQAHSICIAYTMEIVGGELEQDSRETLELRYFPLEKVPKLFCRQHEELLTDLKRRLNGTRFHPEAP